jgi:hypothetical protein
MSIEEVAKHTPYSAEELDGSKLPVKLTVHRSALCIIQLISAFVSRKAFRYMMGLVTFHSILSLFFQYTALHLVALELHH